MTQRFKTFPNRLLFLFTPTPAGVFHQNPHHPINAPLADLGGSCVNTHRTGCLLSACDSSEHQRGWFILNPRVTFVFIAVRPTLTIMEINKTCLDYNSV
ncbi:hypothetical protein CEXT_620631 [Caerostris extrusa]|uniref:Secreted protein n=1 Tax=Caerostris extrusa TaxID=172846 RepID=A0AAV4QJ46_CAEEX|nr:hypothetical protein CEXT_620631 [Caerostris extrusa]